MQRAAKCLSSVRGLIFTRGKVGGCIEWKSPLRPHLALQDNLFHRQSPVPKCRVSLSQWSWWQMKTAHDGRRVKKSNGDKSGEYLGQAVSKLMMPSQKTSVKSSHSLWTMNRSSLLLKIVCTKSSWKFKFSTCKKSQKNALKKFKWTTQGWRLTYCTLQGTPRKRDSFGEAFFPLIGSSSRTEVMIYSLWSCSERYLPHQRNSRFSSSRLCGDNCISAIHRIFYDDNCKIIIWAKNSFTISPETVILRQRQVTSLYEVTMRLYLRPIIGFCTHITDIMHPAQTEKPTLLPPTGRKWRLVFHFRWTTTEWILSSRIIVQWAPH